MAYVGQQMKSGDRFDVFSSMVKFIWVPSSSQPCGHILIKIGVLNQGVSKNLYFHIPGPGLDRGVQLRYGINTRPFFMDDIGFHRYLQENKKDKNRIVRIVKPITTEDKKIISRNLYTLMMMKWTYSPTSYNCQTFIEAIVESTNAQIADNTIRDCPANDFKIPYFQKEIQNAYWKKYISVIMSK